MLEPDRRHLLLDALRPPAGMTLDHAVGTTFSLDLEALLLAPVAFALFDARLAETGDTRTDPIAVMEAVRRHAAHIDLFCQAGQIALPPREKPILSLMEESVHPASAPSPQYLFHPKVWCLRFRASATNAVAYRLLILSRNLTFDRSWDTIVRLDGSQQRKRFPLNEPLASFIATLPGLATRLLPSDRIEAIERLATEVRSVSWELPEGFSDFRFVPAGLPGVRHQQLVASDRLLIMSPFLTNQQLQKLADTAQRATLVSRPESLDLIHGDLLAEFDEVLVLSETTNEQESSDEQTAGQSPVREETAERPGALNRGIHAKVLIAEQGSEVAFRTGSTNATNAGWGGNVEFDIELTGRRNRCGVGVVLGDNAAGTTLRALLESYRRQQVEPLPLPDSERLAVELERYGRELGRIPLRADVESDGEFYRMILRSDRPLPMSDLVEIKCWPISRPPEVAVSQSPGRPVHLSQGALSLQALTSFFAFELSANSKDGRVAIRIVTNARLVGAPEDRAERLLSEQLKTTADVLRYLLFLLADLGDDSAFDLTALLASHQESENGKARDLQIPLFESMVKALARNPQALTPIDRLIHDLSRTDAGRALLPEGLDKVWPIISQARSQLS